MYGRLNVKVKKIKVYLIKCLITFKPSLKVKYEFSTKSIKKKKQFTFGLYVNM